MIGRPTIHIARDKGMWVACMEKASGAAEVFELFGTFTVPTPFPAGAADASEIVIAEELQHGDLIVIDGIAAEVEYVTASGGAETCRVHYVKPGNRIYSRIIRRSCPFEVVR